VSLKEEYLSVLLGKNEHLNFNQKLKDALLPKIFEAYGLKKMIYIIHSSSSLRFLPLFLLLNIGMIVGNHYLIKN